MKAVVYTEYGPPEVAKLMDVSKLSALGWEATITLEEGIQKTYAWFLNNQAQIKEVKLWRRHSLPASPAKTALT